MKKLLLTLCCLTLITGVGCATVGNQGVAPPQDDYISGATPPIIEEEPPIIEPDEEEPEEEVEQVKQKSVYVRVTADSVNLRAGAGVNYTVKGQAQKGETYAMLERIGDWVKLGYKDSTVYVSAKYCVFVEIEKSEDEQIERVISHGYSLLGTKYVYGAVRYHDGTGRKLKGFTTSKFDCSSLMQYMFSKGANTNLGVTTRHQVKQGKTIQRADIERGDLLFFTNAERYNKVGVERVGHVAIYLGDNYILHTASDFARIEPISAQRWKYFIQAQRMV